MARSLGKLNEDDLRWIGSERTGSHERIARAGSGSVLPESIPEEGGDTSGGKNRRDGDTKQAERMERIRKLRDRDSKFYSQDMKKLKETVSKYYLSEEILLRFELYSVCDDDTDRTLSEPNTELFKSCYTNEGHVSAEMYLETTTNCTIRNIIKDHLTVVPLGNHFLGAPLPFPPSSLPVLIF